MSKLLFKNDIYDIFCKILNILILINSVSLLGVMFIVVVNRYLIHFAMPWTTEVIKLLFIWLMFLAGSVGIKKGSHIGIKILENRISSHSIKKGLVILREVILICFLIWMTILALSVTWSIYKTGQVTMALGLPYAFWYLAIPVGFILTLIFLLIRLLPYFKKIKCVKGEGLEI